MGVLLDKNLNHLYDKDFRHEARAAGKHAVMTPTNPTGSNACAATASQYYIALELLHSTIVSAQTLANTLLNSGYFDKLVLKELLTNKYPGALIVCIDANGNGLSDHVWHNYGPIYPAKPGYGPQETTHAGWTWAVDNHQDDPYPRDFNSLGHYTDAAYGLILKGSL